MVLLKLLILSLSIAFVISAPAHVSKENNGQMSRMKRQIPAIGLLDYYQDYLYDYYDWVCDERLCRLCNVLSSECCDPDFDTNCFLPDTCLNNPCLFGGSCVPTRTFIDNRPDFLCICKAGLTGKYCQLTDNFL